MNKQDWCENRILWRANQHNLFEGRCNRFSELSVGDQQYVQSRITLSGKPIFIFFNDRNLWTLLTTEEIGTFHNGKCFRGLLNDIQKSVSLWSDSATVNKHTANYLILNNLGFKVWAPAGKELNGLWSILMMFPIESVIK